MCNCNNNRANYSLQKGEDKRGMVKVKLTGNQTQVINGDITGRTYIFNKKNEVQWVDMRDVDSLKGVKSLKILG